MKSVKQILGMGFSGLLCVLVVMPAFIVATLSIGVSEGVVYFGILLFYFISLVIGIFVLKSARNQSKRVRMIAYILGVLNVTAFIWQVILLIVVVYLFVIFGGEIKGPF